MDLSPLVKAHDHARAASVATQTADTTVAINHHAQAAGEFANAAKSTTSTEALRTLALLEQHHKRLAELLKVPIEPTSQPSSVDSDIPEEDEEKASPGQDAGIKSAKSDRAGPPSLATPPSAAKPLPTLSQHPRYRQRDLSSSIASKLASARGIRSRYQGQSQPLNPSVSNDQAPGNLEVHPRNREGSLRGGNKGSEVSDRAQKQQPSWVPPGKTSPTKEDAAGSSSKPQISGPDSPTATDDGFARFYSTFGSLINRLSAPLAFAGLPLTAEDSSDTASPVLSPEIAPRSGSKPPRQPKATTVSASSDPDLTKIYSRATLRTLARDGHAPADSFYVVPTSGHTASYASILNHEQKEKRRLAASIHGHRDHGNGHPLDDQEEDEDDFVDARESQIQSPPVLPLSSSSAATNPSAFRKRLGRPKTEKDLTNVIEELHMENQTLKDALDKVSRRLHTFEVHSQTSTLALAQSIRLQHPGTGTGTGTGGTAGHGSPINASGVMGATAQGGARPEEVAALKRRNRELEEQMMNMTRQMAVMEKDYDKLQKTVEKYRERWEQLKAGAKARREAQQSLSGQGSGGNQGEGVGAGEAA
ncbi:hypothetical protein GE21DRAFT_6492 [Neurospora crassa]|uniref:Uncharacterized protein n=1 Tax=Neurospora crassa (strain ATCC 24698 / 74-OR23-1A / CBS 708.71 / DSM 1257 / FGSC 987) TaxID=367110 RepID=Q7SAF0_NEUCR|nr:hypothetical protein NCU07000 [Neurospora crassa OR74A]EAA33404.1 hypothetical protein NCU07000 [Neurospora crassa OR74A]KHE79355.1 hypothetical protein GE21DRAFT_6492 [Neurospora crassa]|eukprot:XP_962640.1 hypothetical protein NCU07000 [Neurospora crassa OR74A]